MFRLTSTGTRFLVSRVSSSEPTVGLMKWAKDTKMDVGVSILHTENAYQWPTHSPHASHAIFLIGYPHKIGLTTGEDPALTLGYILGYPQEKKLKPVPNPPNRRRVPYPSGSTTLG